MQNQQQMSMSAVGHMMQQQHGGVGPSGSHHPMQQHMMSQQQMGQQQQPLGGMPMVSGQNQQQQQLLPPHLQAQQQQQQSLQAHMMLQQQQQHQQQLQQQQQQAQQQQISDALNLHPANRVKLLMVDLKQSLHVLVRLAAEVAKTEPSGDSSNVSDNNKQQIAEPNLDEFQRAYENFFSICDQVEECFILLLETERMVSYSNLFLPFNVNVNKNVEKEEAVAKFATITLPQFNNIVKRQIDYARIVHKSLCELMPKLQ